MSDTPVTPLNPASEPQTADFRQLPHNIEAEQGLLGALLINNDALDQVADFLKPAYFHDPVHQRIFRGHQQAYRQWQSRFAGDAENLFGNG